MKRKFLFFLLLIPILFSACRGSQAGSSEGGEEKKKKKVKKCKEEACHVRLNHYHEGSEVRGKRGWLFTSLFAPKSPMYGQGNPRWNRKRDPGTRNKSKR